MTCLFYWMPWTLNGEKPAHVGRLSLGERLDKGNSRTYTLTPALVAFGAAIGG
ncbi:MAG: hypothetical protein JW821_07715 [Deltaproteobacteria bacterium]|nr:hypothetical protein [Deltaproteobacteria bacterium]